MVRGRSPQSLEKTPYNHGYELLAKLVELPSDAAASRFAQPRKHSDLANPWGRIMGSIFVDSPR